MVEPWIVDPVVGGSNPLIHPIVLSAYSEDHGFTHG